MKTDIQNSDNLARQHLGQDSFVQYYRQITGLQFPIEVADVLELRAALNQAIDDRNPEQLKHGLQQFNDAVADAINDFGIKDDRHINRLTKLMCIFRDLQHSHNSRSRIQERSLRKQVKDNLSARSRSISYGLITFVLAITGLLVWMIADNALWFIKVGIGLLAYMSADYFFSLKTLKLEHNILTNELNLLLRRRVQTIDWSSLIQKSAMVLGFKNDSGIDVFLLNDAGKHAHNKHTYH